MIKVFLPFLFFCSLYYSAHSSFSEECSPNNPTGVNQDTLCIKHHSSLFKKKNTDFGSGVNAHYGPSVDPLRPGIGTPFNDKKLVGNEFYSSVSAGDQTNGIRVETNKGKVYKKSR